MKNSETVLIVLNSLNYLNRLKYFTRCAILHQIDVIYQNLKSICEILKKSHETARKSSLFRVPIQSNEKTKVQSRWFSRA